LLAAIEGEELPQASEEEETAGESKIRSFEGSDGVPLLLGVPSEKFPSIVSGEVTEPVESSANPFLPSPELLPRAGLAASVLEGLADLLISPEGDRVESLDSLLALPLA